MYSRAGLTEYLKIAVPSMLMLCFEWWAYEILAFSASWISVSALGAQIIAYNFFLLIFSLGFGFQVGSMSCVGAALGAGQPEKARYFSKLSCLYSTLICVCAAALMYCFPQEIAEAYTKDE